MPYVVDHARGTLIPPFDGTLRVDGPGPPLPSRRLDSTVGDCQGIERVLPRALSAVRRAFRYVRGYAHIVAVERGYRGRRLCRGGMAKANIAAAKTALVWPDIVPPLLCSTGDV